MDWLKVRLGSPVAYALAVAVAAVAVLLRLRLERYLEGVEFTAFFPAALVTAYLLGAGPGIVTAVLCGFATWYLIIPPHPSWEIASRGSANGLALYFLLAPAGAVAVGALRRANTQLRDAERRQQVLIAELLHRGRNLLAVVRSTSQQTLRSSTSLETYGAKYDDRLAALSRVQSLLSRGSDHIDLEEILRAELMAHSAEPGDGRVVLAGPPVSLCPDMVQTVALAVHELGTNAIKYGALSQDTGRLAITWKRDGSERRGMVEIDWQEHGVKLPRDAAASASGFGRQLIEKALPYNLEARTQFEFTSDGIHCRIELPVIAAEDGDDNPSG